MAFTIWAFGNPLLDLVVQLTSDEEVNAMVEKYGLEVNVGQEADTEANGLLQEALRMRPGSSPGGCALNTCRVLHWLEPELKVKFFGSVGCDENADKLKELILKDGVDPDLIPIKNPGSVPTGHCVALVHGQERTMVANLGAASEFDGSGWTLDRVRGGLLPDSVYVTGFFAHHSWRTAETVIKRCKTAGKKVCFNLNGEYVCRDENHVRRVSSILRDVDYLFGNRCEFEAFVETAVKTGASRLKNGKLIELMRDLIIKGDPNSTDLIRERLQDEDKITLIVSDGGNPLSFYTLAGIDGDRVTPRVIPELSGSVSVPEIPEEEIKDTIGAGDSFVSGFMAGLAHTGRSTRECILNGIYSSQAMIRQSGTGIPPFRPNPPF